MKTTSRASSLVAVASLAAAFAITSCSLPPREAWNQIKRDGLIAFLANPTHSPAVTAPEKSTRTPSKAPVKPAGTAVASNADQFVGPPNPAASIAATTTPAPTASNSPSAAPPVLAPTNTPRNIMPAQDKPMLASAVPSLPGYVRSPYTVPPRLVDVKNSAPGATMVCPYTQRPFVIPQDFVNPPAEALASNVNPAPVKPIAQPPTIAVKESAPSTPSTTPNSSASITTPAPNPPANALFSDKPATSTPPAATNTAAAKSAAPEIPYGMPIPNRPGFVNSPFAAKHQLVDVTGLTVGMEVKCPYTGKLFKVPASDIAEQKAVAAPGTIPAPEKVEKK